MTNTEFADKEYSSGVAMLLRKTEHKLIQTTPKFYVDGLTLKSLPILPLEEVGLHTLFKYFYSIRFGEDLENSFIRYDKDSIPNETITHDTLVYVGYNAEAEEEYPVDAVLHSYLTIENQ